MFTIGQVRPIVDSLDRKEDKLGKDPCKIVSRNSTASREIDTKLDNVLLLIVLLKWRFQCDINSRADLK